MAKKSTKKAARPKAKGLRLTLSPAQQKLAQACLEKSGKIKINHAELQTLTRSRTEESE